MASVLERELTCSICTDILLDPVTFIKCLHTNCGACAKSWFKQNDTCPVCRRKVEDTGVNSTIGNLLEDFIAKNPDKQRTPQELAEARKIYQPGQKVLQTPAGRAGPTIPPVFPGARGGLGYPVPSERNVFPALNPRAFPSSRQEIYSRLLRQTPALPTPTPSGASSPGNGAQLAHLHEIERMLEEVLALGHNTESLTRPFFNHLAPNPFAQQGPAAGPRNVAELLAQERNGPISITCDACSSSINNNSLHYECTSCYSPLYHLCLRCYRDGSRCPHPDHKFLPQKLIGQPNSTQILQTGTFCSICNVWTDEDRASRLNLSPSSFFWHCATCNEGKWTYCQSCVHRGKCCNHVLHLWTNNRPAAGFINNASARGTAPHIQGPSRALSTFNPRASSGGREWLLARQYVRWDQYFPICDICQNEIVRSQRTWWHCFTCREGDWDVCNDCQLTRYGGLCSASGRHQLARMEFTAMDQGGSMRVVKALPVERPGFVDPSTEATTAVALRGVWAGQSRGDMRWGQSEGHLWFPEGATIEDVVYAFDEDGTRWYWGVYAGLGGVFNGDAVSIEDSGAVRLRRLYDTESPREVLLAGSTFN